MSNGDVIRYNDVRRFGYMTLFPAKDMAEHPLFRALGVEPLSGGLSPAYLAERASGKAQPLKPSSSTSASLQGSAISMSARRCSGPVCRRTPRQGCLRRASEAKRLRSGFARASRACSKMRSLRRLLDPRLPPCRWRGRRFQEKFDVYGREGEPCHNACGALIHRKAQHGRSTFYCPSCQAKL